MQTENQVVNRPNNFESTNDPFYKIELSFACRGLASMESLSDTDAYLEVFQLVKGMRQSIGKTKVVYNSLNPQFPESFPVDFYFERIQPFLVEAYHFKSSTSIQLIGKAEFNLSELMGCRDDILENELIDPKSGKSNRGIVT